VANRQFFPWWGLFCCGVFCVIVGGGGGGGSYGQTLLLVSFFTDLCARVPCPGAPRCGLQQLVPGDFESGCVFPGAFETDSPSTFTLSPGASFDSLRTVPRHIPAGPGAPVKLRPLLQRQCVCVRACPVATPACVGGFAH
jgi:hypothetical protein